MNEPATTVRIATWNVNSVKARMEHLIRWLREASPDIVLLQELKCETAAFPALEIESLGYNLAVFGQKTYNGVAILSKYPIDEAIRGIPVADAQTDEQARYIEALISLPNAAIRVASVYVPNGQSVDSDKFQYKLRFFKWLQAHLATLVRLDEAVVIGGDYNVAPYPIDVHNPAALDGSVCYHPQERAALRQILHSGYYDAFRAKNPNLQQFSWWDYRAGAYTHNHGLRIDHLLCSPVAMDTATGCFIDETTRKWDKPSDHVPVVAELRIPASS